MWPDTQTLFAASLKDPQKVPPAATHGFNVYRNNVSISLKTALADTYPVIKRLVGEEFFDAMAGVFWRQSPPKSPVLAEWGQDFPTFLETFEPAQSLPFLADVAKIEWAWLHAYHAEDQKPASVDLLSTLGEEGLEENCFQFHPSFGFVSSPWPVVSIWQAHLQENPDLGSLDMSGSGENALIIRPEFDVNVHQLDGAETSLIQSCLNHQSISQSLEALSEYCDPANALISLFQRGVIVGVQSKNQKRENT